MTVIPDEKIMLVIQSTIEFYMDRFPVEFWSYFDKLAKDLGYIYEDDAADYLVDARKPVH
jgi:hypothetical protein